MKGKFRLLSILSAVVIGATASLTACGSGTVAEHDHEWDEGKITTESTCYSEGVRTFTCTVDGCGQTKTTPIAMTAHSWDDGEVTTEPTCQEEGVKTYKCTVEGCNKTKEEAVDKTDHRWNDGEITKVPDFVTKGAKKLTCLDCKTERTVSVAERADFAEGYYTSATEQTDWLYAYAEDLDEESFEGEFLPLEQFDEESGMWKKDGTQIGKGYIYSETNAAMIAYTVPKTAPEKIQANVTISFKGEESETRFNAYFIVLDKDGMPTKHDPVELNKENTREWSYQTEKALDMAQGDIAYLILVNKGEGKAGGSLTFTLTAPCVHVWSGKVTPATCTEKGERVFTCLSCDEKIIEEIDKVPHEYDYDNGRITKEATETEDGEIEYKCKHCDDTVTDVIPKLTPFNGADYETDFTTSTQSQWQYGYTTDYNYDNNTFTFNEATPDEGAGAWKDSGGGIEIKRDWIKNETGGANAAVRYMMPQTRAIKIALSFVGSDATETRITGRLHIQKRDGTVQLCDFIDGKFNHTWTHNKTVTVEAGSAITILLFNEYETGKGYWHGKLSMTLTLASDEPEPGFVRADFADDFHDDQTQNNWEYGYAEYDFNSGSKAIKANKDGTESFDYHAATYNDENKAWTATDVEIKKGWISADKWATIVYNVDTDANVDIAIAFKGPDDKNTHFAVRLVIVTSEGNVRYNEFIGDGANSSVWSKTFTNVEIKNGDKIYLMFDRQWASSNNGNGDLTYTLTAHN